MDNKIEQVIELLEDAAGIANRYNLQLGNGAKIGELIDNIAGGICQYSTLLDALKQIAILSGEKSVMLGEIARAAIAKAEGK